MNEAVQPAPADPEVLALIEALMSRVDELEEGYNALADLALNEKDKLEILMQERARRMGSSAINSFVHRSDHQTELNNGKGE